MLRSKYILFILFFLLGIRAVAQIVETQHIAPQLSDTLNVHDSVADTLALADAEFEAWLEQYATITSDSVASPQVAIVPDTLDSDKKSDFTSLIDEGEDARQRERNALISNVMSSFKKKVEDKPDTAVVKPQQPVAQLSTPDTLPLAEVSKVRVLYDSLQSQLSALNLQHNTLAPDSLLADVDSTLQQTDFGAAVNPLFIDWVIGTLPAVSLSLDDTDSVIVLLRTQAKSYVRATAPELYAYHRSQLPEMSDLKIDQMHHGQKETMLLNLDSINRRNRETLKVDLPEMSRWSKGAKFQAHISQNYISRNWYKGGESNMATTLYAMGYFNYDNRHGLQWDNKAEWKLGLYGMASDSLRWLRVNEDLVRLNSKLGYKAFKNFFYTAEWDFQTSLFNTYKSNTYIRTSGPFSPIRMNLSAGMDYKYKKVSVFLSPLSYKLVYVADMRVKDGLVDTDNIAHQVGITDGTRYSNQLGALIRTDFDHDFNESIGMEVHFSFFGAYVGKIKGVEVGCEVIGNFKINRFLSAKLSLYPRYDSTTIPADGGKPKLQFYELISLGFNYKL